MWMDLLGVYFVFTVCAWVLITVFNRMSKRMSKAENPSVRSSLTIFGLRMLYGLTIPLRVLFAVFPDDLVPVTMKEKRMGDKVYVHKDLLKFLCPACREIHTINVGVNGWRWDGSFDAPIIYPSIRVSNGHYNPDWKEGEPCWCSFKRDNPESTSFDCRCCHSVIDKGFITFFSDSSHEMRGKAVMLPDWEES